MTYNDVPVDVLPDADFAKAKDLYLYKYGAGTKTLDSVKLDENKRQYDLSMEDNRQAREAQSLADALKLAEQKRQFGIDFGEKQRQFNQSSTEQKRQFDISYAHKQQSDATTKAFNDNKNLSEQKRDIFISVLRQDALNNPKYNFTEAYQKASASGALDDLSPSDMAAVLKEIAALQQKWSDYNPAYGEIGIPQR